MLLRVVYMINQYYRRERIVGQMELSEIKELYERIDQALSKIIVGKEEVIKLILTAILAGGHVLIEDKPGTGKTMLAKSFAKCIGGDFKRVQFTPDLMPSDITGLNIYDRKTSEFTLIKGPVFTNILLADEINRATPRTQSSLLESMEERQVSIDGNTYVLDDPFVVLATQNPVETTGTYPLPEAQLDRFIMKISMGDNSKECEMEIIEKYIEENPFLNLSAVCDIKEITEAKQTVKQVFVHDCIRNYILDIIFATRQNDKLTYGVSTRGTLALLRCAQSFAALSGKSFVEPDDVRMLAPYVLCHRVVTFGNSRTGKSLDLIKEIVSTIPVPVEDWEK